MSSKMLATASAALVLAVSVSADKDAKQAMTPPMGWMAWEVFRCNVDCKNDPEHCLSEKLFTEMGDRMAEDGFLAAGYTTVSIDDCWASLVRKQGKLEADPERFPNGMKAVADHLHSKGVRFGIYGDMGTKTCGGYPGSKDFEQVDANTFAEWGVDYVKLDGCYNDVKGFEVGYPKFGQALRNTGRNMVYSCSWPAYLGDDETQKPFKAMIDAGCHLWRNWADVQGTWDSVVGIINHFGNYSKTLQSAAGNDGTYGGHWNDMDMLLLGEAEEGGLPGISIEEAKTQMGLWSIMAAPLIMGNDLRNLTQASKDILQNPEVIGVNQDSMAKAGLRISPYGNQEVWARQLSNRRLAVGLLNKGEESASVTASFAELGWPAAKAAVRDLFARKQVGQAANSISMTVPAHGLSLLLLSPVGATAEELVV